MVGYQPFTLGANQKTLGIKEDRKDRRLLEQDRFGFLKRGIARGLIALCRPPRSAGRIPDPTSR